MKQLIQEAKRLQKLAGIIKEEQSPMRNISDELEEAGFEFDDGILGGVGSGGAGYYDWISDKISGFHIDKFDQNEFDKWYDSFSKDSFNNTYYDSKDLEDYDIDINVLENIQEGIYLVGEKEMGGQAEIHNDHSVTLYALPTLSNESEDLFKVIFSLGKNGEVIPEMEKEEVASLLRQNTEKPGSWGII